MLHWRHKIAILGAPLNTEPGLAAPLFSLPIFLPLVFPIPNFWEDFSRDKLAKYLILLATPTGFEPVTLSLEG